MRRCLVGWHPVMFEALHQLLNLKGELEVIQIYFRKMPLHQQKFLVVLVLSTLPWLLRNLKKCPK